MVNNSRGFNYKKIHLNVATNGDKLKETIETRSGTGNYQFKGTLSFKSLKSTVNDRQLLSTPVFVIIFICAVSAVLVCFLVYFYKKVKKKLKTKSY